jgi:hypothetical protein
MLKYVVHKRKMLELPCFKAAFFSAVTSCFMKLQRISNFHSNIWISLLFLVVKIFTKMFGNEEVEGNIYAHKMAYC